MKIAIVKLSALGDIVHAMVALQFIKTYNQKIEIDWVVEEGYKELLEFHPDINKVHVVKIKKAKMAKSFFLLLNEIKKVKQFGSYDLVIDLQGLIKSAVISRLISSPITIGFDKSSIRESIASFFYNKSFKCGYEENVIERNLKLIKYALELSFAIEEVKYKQPFLYSSKQYFFPNLSNIKKNILLVPGASFKSKRIPVIKFSELTKMLDANFFIIWGNQEEKIIADKIKFLSPSVNVCEKLSIKSLISLITQVDLVIGSDTGPTHMAWALNQSSITIFGPTPGHRNSYLTPINKIVQSTSLVNPLKIDQNDFSIKTIEVSEIVKISKTLLELK